MKLLEKHFEIALETPDGITRLRELILKLAMQGKLVDQNPNDKPAQKLLEEIEKEKERLLKSKLMKKQSSLEAIKKEQIPYLIPNNWKWTRLGNFVSLLGDGIHGTPEYDNNGDYYFINGNNLIDGKIEFKENTKTVSYEQFLKHQRNLDENTVFVSINGTIGNVAFYNNEKVILGKSACYFNLIKIDKFFIKKLINSKYFLNYAFSSATGTTIKNVSLKTMREFPVPLPPLEEQKRIVEKIDQLMLLCDKLEAERNRKNKLQLQMNSAAINNLIKANDEITFNNAWSFIANQFDTLYTVKQNVTVLKDVILNLAIKGKLVGQNDNDESIENYLKKIVEEKNDLLKKGLMKKQASFPIKDNDFPFSIPHRWNWIRLGEIVSLLGDGIHGTPQYDIHGEYYFINGNNLTDGKIEIKENTKTVSNEQFIKHKRNLNDKTVFVSINGTIGNVAFYNNEKIILGKSACYFNLVNVNKNYIKIIINSSYFLNYAFSSATGTTIKNVSLKTMRELPIPLPPLNEQERIVERVNQLFKLCDTLEKNIEQSSQKQSQILNAVLAQL